jgi:hypothetical protein
MGELIKSKDNYEKRKEIIKIFGFNLAIEYLKTLGILELDHV